MPFIDDLPCWPPILDSQTDVLEEAFRLFASTNGWDYLVVLEKDHTPKEMVRIGPNGHLIHPKFTMSIPNHHVLSLLRPV